MSRDSYAKVICPYYRGETKTCIRCESPIRAQYVSVNMKSSHMMQEHRDAVCSSFYYGERCAIARMNNTKYREESHG